MVWYNNTYGIVMSNHNATSHDHNNNMNSARHYTQGLPAPPAGGNASASAPPVHSWYPANGYHHPQAAVAAAVAAAHQLPAADQQLWDQPMWHHHLPHSVFSNGGDFSSEFIGGAAAAGPMMDGHHHAGGGHNHLMPSPTITVSGSELSASPGVDTGSGVASPPIHLQHPHHNHMVAHHMPHHHQAAASGGSRPPPARSPYEWIKKTSYQSQPNPGKTRTKDKYRVVYTDHQRVELEKEFYYSRYITIRRKAELANTLGLSERQVKIWFQNRRAKERKQVKKREEFSQKDAPLSLGQMTQTSQLASPSLASQLSSQLLIAEGQPATQNGQNHMNPHHM